MAQSIIEMCYCYYIISYPWYRLKKSFEWIYVEPESLQSIFTFVFFASTQAKTVSKVQKYANVKV